MENEIKATSGSGFLMTLRFTQSFTYCLEFEEF